MIKNSIPAVLNRRTLMNGGIVAGVAIAAGAIAAGAMTMKASRPKAKTGWQLSEEEWKQRLTPEQFYILRQAGTEPPFTHPFNKEKREGNYHCAGCALPVFSSATKYNSGTGWPSFWTAIERATATSRDFAIGYARTETHCARCGGHLGHIFDDGPKPTGKRHCINGLALDFVAA